MAMKTPLLEFNRRTRTWGSEGDLRISGASAGYLNRKGVRTLSGSLNRTGHYGSVTSKPDGSVDVTHGRYGSGQGPAFHHFTPDEVSLHKTRLRNAGVGAGIMAATYGAVKLDERRRRKAMEREMGKNVEAALQGFYKYAEDDPAPKRPRGVIGEVVRGGAKGGAIGGVVGAVGGAAKGLHAAHKAGFTPDREAAAWGAGIYGHAGAGLGAGIGAARGLGRGLRNKRRYKRELAEHQARQAEGKTTEAALSILFGG